MFWQWAGQKLSGFYAGGNGIGAGLEVAGWLQTASGAVLTAAGGFMVWRRARTLLVLVRRAYGTRRASEAIDVSAADPQGPQLGTVVPREPGDAGRRRPGGDRPSVDFSDEDRGPGHRPPGRD